ncbi:MAG: type I-U CRISPR-associated helicase/endonuclease Cas3 [Acidobacteria bacterium]|nr:type I-U CRISPR-associated helicase/endonuclease Cas3 [Acidobacteriota bacterium]
MSAFPTFPEFFEALWGYGPFPWQTMLADRLAQSRWPRLLDLPTASGKTACIDAALYALAVQAARPLEERTAPRRIWFVVDRRIVVDEAFERAKRLSQKLGDSTEGPLAEVAKRLRTLSGTRKPLVASRLRGGSLRGDSWARLPNQPAIITSTVDQLGSRLLFRGYGRGLRTAPIWAGLAANDSLILLDEAHCSVPFLQTLLLIERYRGEQWAERPIRTPFAFSILSATPPQALLEAADEFEKFPGAERERALDHPILAARLNASKPAELRIVKSAKTKDAFVSAAAEQAQAYLAQGRQKVAVIVNRVRTAVEVGRELSAKVGADFDVEILTGRLRPHDRDALLKRVAPTLRASDPVEPTRKTVLVSTQCIEVGADFSFDAMVTEAASLDALRQRFGRLNRMGLPGAAPATILIRDKDAAGDKDDDPVYGQAITKCWGLLWRRAATEEEGKNERTVADFGVNAFDDLLQGVEEAGVDAALAPHTNAPVLLPAHLDLLCQTAPQPAIEPEVALYLHGLERAAPEARVVWRADLSVDNREPWLETVALCPPLASEMLTVPLWRLRQWLSVGDADQLDESSDVEGEASSGSEEGSGGFRPVMVWRGLKESKLAEGPGDIAPNDLVIAPAAYGMGGLAQAADAVDIWELCRASSDQCAAVRLHGSVLGRWPQTEGVKALQEIATDESGEYEGLEDAIQLVLETAPPQAATEPSPFAEWLTVLRSCRGAARRERHPTGGLVLFASAPKLGEESELFADDDDLRSLSGETPLADHCRLAERAAGLLSRSCLPPELAVAVREAALWHDVGKLDPRFQLMLRQGDEALAAAEPIAKSRFIPSSPARRRVIQAAAGLPLGFRHEMLSAVLAERTVQLSSDDPAVPLHLIASHHGYARPFAPVSPDDDPANVDGEVGGVPFALSARERMQLPAPHRADSGISERFWRLNRRYGWWGLAYLEGMVRLADWYASEHPLELPEPESRTASSAGAPRAVFAKPHPEPIVLTGLDGGNPLGFLAALGTLVALGQAGCAGVRMHWRRSAVWQPVITAGGSTDEQELSERIAVALQGDSVAASAEAQRSHAESLFFAAKKALRSGLDQVKARKLRGKERKQALAELEPLRRESDDRRSEWLDALKQAVPRPELALGKHINCTAAEFRGDHAAALIAASRFDSREPLDLLAAFASDACVDKRGSVVPTPFCFITGSGHQYFLDTVRQLLERVSPDEVHKALFQPWRYENEKFSMRWDPSEDRRYALLDRDPTASGNKSRTVWMANLLAYRALAVFPSAPGPRWLQTTGWTSRRDSSCFTWPIWTSPLQLDSIASLLGLAELQGSEVNRAALRQRGVLAAFQARRILVGSPPLHKINFSPAVQV